MGTAESIAHGAVLKMLRSIWSGYDLLAAELLAEIAVEDGGDEAERTITRHLARGIQRSLSGYEPYFCQPSYRENETRLAPPAQAPEYDIAFVLSGNPRIAWPIEAKVLATPGRIAHYVADIREQFLTCRYAPFSRGGAMVGYLLAGLPDQALQNISLCLESVMEVFAPLADRNHNISRHSRTVPEQKEYPGDFECHHLIMPMVVPHIN